MRSVDVNVATSSTIMTVTVSICSSIWNWQRKHYYLQPLQHRCATLQLYSKSSHVYYNILTVECGVFRRTTLLYLLTYLFIFITVFIIIVAIPTVWDRQIDLHPTHLIYASGIAHHQYNKSISRHSDITHRTRNYYGCLNNILSVLGRGKNEITSVHLVRTYCIPILTYGSEIWHITESEKRSLNVLWNNTFRKIFNCCWRESPFSLQYYTGWLPMHLIIEQQKVLFYRRVLRSSNVILQAIFCLKQRSVNSLTSLYNIGLNVSCDAIKQSIWQYNVRNAADTGRFTFLYDTIMRI